MYSSTLSELINSISEVSNEKEVYDFVDRGMRCYLNSIAIQINGKLYPRVNHFNTLIQASLLSSDIVNNPTLPHIEKLHYLVAMILEQQGNLIARSNMHNQMNESPEKNDYWHLLTLAFFHYLAGGFRVQAKSIINNLLSVFSINPEYDFAKRDLQMIFSDQYKTNQVNKYLDKQKFVMLIKTIQKNRVANLHDLGLNNESEWLINRGIDNANSNHFWRNYLSNLTTRGITTFTKEQLNNDFDSWLKPNNDMLVVLPTGSGKTIIGELRTALTLANNKQVVWLLPTRSLVRQTQIEMKKAFGPLNIRVQELPTTDDFVPLFTNIDLPAQLVAITTPEKLLSLIRVNQNVIDNIGLIIIDEAQNLFENRGFAIESCLYQISTINKNCNIVYLSAMQDKTSKLMEFHQYLSRENELSEIISTNRPTRCTYGILTSINEGNEIPTILCYPPLYQNYKNKARAIYLPKTNCKNPIKPAKLVNYFLKNSSHSNLKSIIFVNQKRSTETRVKEFSKNFKKKTFSQQTTSFIARITLERGVVSPLEKAYFHGIAPHHGALPKVEQVFIEKSIMEGLITTVVATPTLAQGINLPFDISILTFLSRYRNGQSIELSQSEIINMLGRAGRAGMVSDGLALIVRENKSKNKNEDMILTTNRNIFFAHETDTKQLIGLSKILANLLRDEFNAENYLLELNGFTFSEFLSLNIILSKTILQNNDEDILDSFVKEFNKYPSIFDLKNNLNIKEDVSIYFAQLLSPVIKNLYQYTNEILQVISQTGLPVEYIEFIFNKLSKLDIHTIKDPLEFANSLVFDGLLSCQNRHWMQKLLELTDRKHIDIYEGFNAIMKWIDGSSWEEIKNEMKSSIKGDLIDTGAFINNKIAIYAQFWGCLAVCEKILFSDESHIFDFLQPFIRNGVNSKRKLIVLKEIGYLDRVLAHKICNYFELNEEDDISYMESVTQKKLIQWKNNRFTIPSEIDTLELQALQSILDNLYISSSTQ